jgi:hypothetical protein
MKWHAPLPADPRRPLCGQQATAGGPTHRVAKTLDVTCTKCLKKLAGNKPANAPDQKRA